MRNGKIGKQKITLIATCILIATLIYFRDVQGININKYIIVSIIMFVSLFCLNIRNIVVLFCFLIPFLSGIAANYIIMILCFIILIKGNVKLHLWENILLIGLLIIELFNNIGYSVPFIDFTMYAFYFVFIMIILNLDEKITNNSMCIISFCVGTVTALTIILINSLSVINFTMFFEPSYRFGNIMDLKYVNNMVLTHDQNFVGYLSIIGISSLYALSKSNVKLTRFKQVIVLFCTLILTFYGLLTASRAFLISLGALAVLYIINYLFIKRSLKGFLTYLFTILVLYLVLSIYFPGIIENFINRFDEQDITGGRTEINSHYLNLFFSDPKILLLGTGIFPMMEVANYHATIHNAFLQILISYGFIGTIIYLTWYYTLVKREINKRIKKIRFDVMIPHLIGILIIQSIPFISPYYSMLPLLISVFAFRLNDDIS